jgi:uncharacterized OsmC-like protein
MATSKVIYNGNLRTTAVHLFSKTEIITDAPVDNKGRGEAFSPTDLVATSLASCMLTIMGIAADAHGFNIDGTTAEVTKIMGDNPRRIIEIRVDLTFPPNQYSDKHKEFFRRTADSCPVAKSLHPEIKQSIALHF